jgi:hypothetical protein
MSRTPSSLFRKSTEKAFLCGLLLLWLVACSSTLSSNKPLAARTAIATSPPQPTATLRAGTLLYQANWSQGLAGWQRSGNWQVIAGNLQSQASEESSLTIPYQPTVANYAIEVRFRVVRFLGNYASFIIVAQRQPGKDGFQTGFREGFFGYIDPSGSDLRVSTFSGDYELRDGWHTYRIEVRANHLQLFDNGIPLGGGMSSEQTSYLSGGPLSLHARQLVLQVSQLRLLSL